MRPRSLREGLQTEKKERPFVCKPLLSLGGIVTLHGSPKSLKSKLAKNAGLQIAEGGTIWRKWKTKEDVVLYIDQEHAEEMLLDELTNIHGYERFFKALDNFYYVNKDYDLQLDQASGRKVLKQYIDEVGANVVILDPWSEVQPHDDSETNKQLATLREIRKLKENLSLIIVHHDCKPGEFRSGGRAWDMRGAALRQVSDTIVSVVKTHSKRTDETEAQLTFEMRYGSLDFPMVFSYDKENDTFEVTK